MNPGRLAALICSFALGACTYVTVPAPLGDIPAPIEPKEWNGHWVLGRDVVGHVIVTDPERGALELSWIRETKPDFARPRAALVRGQVVLRRVGDVLIASLRLRDEERYLFFALAKDGDRATLWLPDHECIEMQLKTGVLSGGKLSEGHATELALLGLDPARAVSREPGACHIFAWDKPQVARRPPSLEN